jgi:SAM-dependent methyltransferase
MYQTFINYDEEFKFYRDILLKHHCKEVLEIGCGTGNLATPFVKSGFTYSGIDLSEEMLSIARRNNPASNFAKADMRNFIIAEKLQASIIPGRSISYLITNEDANNTFKSINKALKMDGLVCFDFIDASKFIPSIQKGKNVEHHAVFKGKNFRRDSFWSINLIQSWTFDWLSVYYEQEENSAWKKIGEDQSTIRAFTRDEIHLFLKLTGFEVTEVIERSSYAFDTLVIVAMKRQEA